MATCTRCTNCAEQAEQLLALAEERRLLDPNDRETQIMDLIVNLRHRYDQLPERERGYRSWARLLASVETHYGAEVAGEDCYADCPLHQAQATT